MANAAPSLASTLRAQAVALEAQAATLRALADAYDQPSADDLLDLDGIRSRTGFGRTAVLGAIERGELQGAVRVGGRKELRVPRREVDAWFASKPQTVGAELDLAQPVNGNDGADDPVDAAGPTKPTALDSWEALADDALTAPRRTARGRR